MQNKYDVKARIIKTINTCRTKEQLLNCKKLMDNYCKLYNINMIVLATENNQVFDTAIYVELSAAYRKAGKKFNLALRY